MGGAVVEEEFLLGIVEVGVEVGGLRVGFDGGEARAADVQAVVLRAGLQQDALRGEVGQGQGGEEVGEQGGVYLDEFVGIGPDWGAGRRWGLEVGVEEDVCVLGLVVHMNGERSIKENEVDLIRGMEVSMIVVRVMGKRKIRQ